jgi:hypothetical protein
MNKTLSELTRQSSIYTRGTTHSYVRYLIGVTELSWYGRALVHA